MRNSIHACGHKGHGQRALAVTSNRAFGFPTALTSRKTGTASGLLARCLRGCILLMTASREFLRLGAVATFCSPESPPTWVCVPECTFGWGWIGTLSTPMAHCLCPSAAASVSESRNSLGCTFKEGGTMNTKRIALLVVLGSIVMGPVAQAQIKHIEMRVEGMT